MQLSGLSTMSRFNCSMRIILAMVMGLAFPMYSICGIWGFSFCLMESQNWVKEYRSNLKEATAVLLLSAGHQGR